jgi:hypothetical protein
MPPPFQNLKDKTRQRIRNILPESVKPYKAAIIKWGLIGYLIRIAIMPLFAYEDLFLIGRTGALLLQNHQLDIGGYPSTITWIFAAVYALFKPILPSAVLTRITSSTYILPLRLFSFYNLSQPGIMAFIFVSKIPYLVFDLALALLLLHIVSDGKKALLAFKLWIVNPISIYVCYAMGQFDIIPAFFIVLMLYFFKKRRELSSMASLGVSGALKMFGLLLILPAALIYLKEHRSLGSKVKHLSLMLIVGFLPLVLSQVVTFFTPTYYESANLAWPIKDEIAGFFGKASYSRGVQGNQLLSGALFYFTDYSISFATYSFDRIYSTLFVYGLFLFGVVYLGSWSFERVQKAFLVFLLAYYALALFHPNWFLMALPLLILLVAEDIKKYFKLYLLLVPLYFIYVGYWNQLFTSLLIPIVHQAYFWLGQIDLLNSVGLPAYEVISIFRSIFSALCIFFVILMLGIDRLLHRHEIKE